MKDKSTSALLVAAAFIAFCFTGSAFNISDAAAEIEVKCQNLMQLLDHSNKLSASQRQSLQGELDLAFQRLLDFSRLGQNVIGKVGQRYSNREKIQLLEALESAVKKDLGKWHAAAGSGVTHFLKGGK